MWGVGSLLAAYLLVLRRVWVDPRSEEGLGGTSLFPPHAWCGERVLHPVALQRGVPGVHFPLGSPKPRLGQVLSGLSPRPCPLSSVPAAA